MLFLRVFLTANLITVLQPFNLQECIVPHMKDPIHICLEPEAQEHIRTFIYFILHQSAPYLTS